MNHYSYSYLDQLSASEIFQILAEAAEEGQGEFLDGIRVVFTGDPPYNYAALEVPDPYASQQQPIPANRLDVYRKLVEAFKRLTQRGERYTSPGDESFPLLEGVARLLLKSTNEALDRVLNGTDESLAVSRPISDRQAEQLFRAVSFHSTSTRVSSWEVPGGSLPLNRYIFHIKDDPQRKSAFRSLAVSGVLENCVVLKGFEVTGRYVFLEQDAQPGEKKLERFCHFLDKARFLLGRKDLRESSPLLAAVFQWPGEEGGLEFLYLGDMRFFRQEKLTQRKVKRVEFSFMDLKESRENLERLGETIRQAEPYIGYKLELRPTRHLEKNDLKRLNDQKARIEYNLAYLQSIARPRPLLMRFNNRQIPALAAQIRSFPIQAIYEGTILYGFQATPGEPTGYHFIMVYPSRQPREELDPYLLWKDLDSPHTRFHLDPFWARYYFDASTVGTASGAGNALVFVPEGSALFPSIHNWTTGNMDQFLDETMRTWFQDRLKGETIPARPVYIFDGDSHPHSPIYISILDQDKLEPLHTRLGWINDHLIIHHTLENDEILKDMANEMALTRLSQEVKSRAEQARKEFSDAALSAGRYMSQTTSEMTQALTYEIDRVVNETFRLTQKIRKLDERLRQWDMVVADMEDMLQETQELQKDTSRQLREARTEFQRLQQEIEMELNFSESRKKELEEKLASEVVSMQASARRIKQRMKGLKL